MGRASTDKVIYTCVCVCSDEDFHYEAIIPARGNFLFGSNEKFSRRLAPDMLKVRERHKRIMNLVKLFLDVSGEATGITRVKIKVGNDVVRPVTLFN